LSNASLTKYQLTGETLEWWTHFCNMALQDICLGQPTTKEADLTLFSKATKQVVTAVLHWHGNASCKNAINITKLLPQYN
jgi:hypothetical protein